MRAFLGKLFSHSSTPGKSPARRTTRLGIERLDDRLLPSATGSFSQVLDQHGNSVLYSIDWHHNLWERFNGGQAFMIDNSGKDTMVSAGLDANGNAIPYVLNFDGTLWRDVGGWSYVCDGVSNF